MYRGEFEIHGQKVSFDIQDVSGGYVYEFPGMRNVSLSSADAFIIMFSLDDVNTWDEVSRLRDMIHEVKDSTVPIVVAGNKSDLESDKNIPSESLEAIVTFDWENGYVECSAKERRNINKIFKELLQQAKSKYDFSIPQLVSASALVNNPLTGHGHSNNTTEDNLKRRQSLPVVPAGLVSSHHGSGGLNRANTVIDPHGHHGLQFHQKMQHNNSPKGDKRRSSLAALRRDSCKIS